MLMRVVQVFRKMWQGASGLPCKASKATAAAAPIWPRLRRSHGIAGWGPARCHFFFGKKLEETSNTLKEPKLPMFQLCFERISTFRICQEVKSGPSPEAKPTIHKETQTFDNHIIYIFDKRIHCKDRGFVKITKGFAGFWVFGARCRGLGQTADCQRLLADGHWRPWQRRCQAWREFRAQLIARESPEAELWSQIEAESAERFKMRQDASRCQKPSYTRALYKDHYKSGSIGLGLWNSNRFVSFCHVFGYEAFGKFAQHA